MRSILWCVAISFLASPLSRNLLAQGEAAVPFLLISPDVSANGWGGISTAVASDNPMATIANPGQLGLFSLNNYLSASTYTPKTLWLPNFGQSDLTYSVSAANAGLNLSRVLDLPVPIGIGVGYSRVVLNLGTFIVTGPGGPEPLGTFNAFEKSESFSVAVGLEYYVRLGFGMSFDKIVSSLGPLGTPNISATDFGVLLDVPIVGIVEKINGEPIRLTETISPLVNLSAGYAYQNHGGKVVYLDALQSDPTPRNAIIGIGAEIGVVVNVNEQPWKVLTFTLAREAEDLLLVRKPGPATFEYQSGLGDISFFKHVIQGKLDDHERPNLHKGWQLNFGELIYVRGGSFTESPNFGNRNYTTSGIGVRLGGLFKLMSGFALEAGEDNILTFITNHFDIMYSHAEYSTDEGHPLDGTSFSALSLTIK